MDEQEQERLLEEYRANVELWKHDDTLRQQRTGNFLTVNTILLAALGILAGANTTIVVLAGVALFLSVFGLSICYIWRSVLIRSSEYVRFRRFQLRSIEARLPGVTTFSNTYAALDAHQKVCMAGVDDPFIIDQRAKTRSTLPVHFD